MRARSDFAPRPPWATTRRPLTIFAVIAVVALVAVAASVVGRPGRPPSGQLPSGFVTQASRACATMLGRGRPSALPTDPAAVGAEVAQIATLTTNLRALASTTGADAQTGPWLAGWLRFTADERQRAAALGAQPPTFPASTPSSSPAHAVMGAPDPTALAGQAKAEADSADRFATVNSLPACTILARSPVAVQTIPS